MIGYLFILCIENAWSYWLIRNMIYTIVWCDQGVRHCNVRTFRKRFSKWELARMKCLEQYTNTHRKNFRFWIIIKDCFLILELFTLILIVIIHLLPSFNIADCISRIIVAQALIISVVITFQTDIHRKTKYDRIRLKNIHKK